MMVTLIITEMEKVHTPPQSGHRVLLVLDEFAGLKKMDIIENAAAQIAGFGVKMCFIVQQLTQLKNIYKDNWEIFVGNAGTKLFFGIEDKFTREYLSKYLGDTEVIRTTSNNSETKGQSNSTTRGQSHSSGSGSSSSSGSSFGVGSNYTNNSGHSSSSHYSSSSSLSLTEGENESTTTGTNQGIHKRALLTPDEIGLVFSRIEDKNNPAYPGFALALASGKRPLVVHRTNYFDDHMFEQMFEPHPEHGLNKLEPKQQQIEIIPLKRLDEELADEYGLENLQKACEIYQKVKLDFPQLKVAQHDELEFARDILQSAKNSINVAASDGRSHSMGETLEIIQERLGPFLIKNPNVTVLNDFTLNYGDEDTGYAANRAISNKLAKKKIIFSSTGWVVGLSLYFLFLGFEFNELVAPILAAIIGRCAYEILSEKF